MFIVIDAVSTLCLAHSSLHNETRTTAILKFKLRLMKNLNSYLVESFRGPFSLLFPTWSINVLFYI